jgi:putative peptidoglycan lipid II flippase
MIRRSIAVSGVYATGLVCSFLNQIAIAFYFGSGVDVDLYFAALSVATFAGGLVGAILSFGLPAMLVDFAADKQIGNHERAVATSILWLLLVIGILLCLIFSINAHLMAYSAWFAIAQANGRIDAFQRLVVLSWLSCWLNLALSYFSTLASLRRHQVLAGIVYTVPALMSIGAVTLYHSSLGLAAALIGQIAGLVLCAPLLLVVTRGLWTATLGLADGLRIVLAFLRRVPWYLGATLCFTVYPLVDAYLTSWLSAGEYSSLAYSQRLTIAAVNLIIAGPSLLLVKRLCGTLSTSSVRQAHLQLVQSVRMIMLLMTPIAIVSSVFSLQIVRMLFEHGRFGLSGAERTAAVFAAMSPGMVFMGGGVILSRGLVALGREGLATAMSLAWIFFYVVLSAGLSHWYQAPGIAWAYTAAWAIVTCAMLFNLSRLGESSEHGIRNWLGFLSSAAIALAAAKLSHYALLKLDAPAVLCIGAGVITVLVSYGVAVHAAGLLTARQFVQSMRGGR